MENQYENQIFKHFVLTCFNVKLSDPKYASKGLGLDRAWLRHRFKLFDRFCYPSVYGQTCQNFKWIVFFDIDTPQIFKNEIDRYCYWTNLIPVFIHGNEIINEARKIILKNIRNNTKFLITTRLDNDDAIFKDFVFIIQRHFKNQEFQFLNFTNGYLLTSRNLYLHEHMSNPYISLIEKLQGFKTVWCGEHNKLSAIGPIEQITCEPAWLTVIHGRNLSNNTTGILQPPSKLRDLYNKFTIKKSLLINIVSLVFYLLKNILKPIRKLSVRKKSCTQI